MMCIQYYLHQVQIVDEKKKKKKKKKKKERKSTEMVRKMKEEREKPNLGWTSASLRITSWSGVCLWVSVCVCVCNSQNADFNAEA